jgi:flagellar L-ring protein precursor FlgH
MTRNLPVFALLAVLPLAACGAGDRLSNVGRTPPMSAIRNPITDPNYVPVSMPMPNTTAEIRQANSLWQSGARSFLKDQRANQVGDLVSVTVSIDDKAQVKNETQRSRNNAETAGLTNFLGLEAQIPKALNKAANPASLVNGASKSTNDGVGQIDRNEKITLKVAAAVIQTLPNGNLVIHGKQEVRINFEIRELELGGVIRPEDIANDNTISYEKIAEARISYGGRGQLSDAQQPRYGQQVFDILFPF